MTSGCHQGAVGDVLGKPLTVHIKLNSGKYRYFHGIVTYFAKVGPTHGHTRYVAVLNPQLSLFEYTRDCRIMDEEGQTALSIVTDVLAKRGFTDVDSGSIKDHTYRQHDYCVQYRESDLNFVHRLLEEEGIYYFFKHENGLHTMVLADSTTAHAKVPGYETVLCRPMLHAQARDEEHFWSLRVTGGLYPGKLTVVRGYDYTLIRPSAVQFGQQPSGEPRPGSDFEDYDYPGGLSPEAEANQEALVRMQMDRVANTVIEVEGNTMGLGVGALVSLAKPLSIDGIAFNPFWGEDGFAKEYLITSARYSISINQYESGDVAKSDQPFKASYTLLDSQVQFRPQRGASKPRIEGPQTAVVVGPADEEICTDTDKLGRVKVQFDWDRLGKHDEKSSCWVRVSQAWAGAKWGAFHLPRIGHEVIVEFLDGDPDRPIVTGRVYNADNLPPYDSPTQSGIKSRSTKGGTPSNFNEIRFEDLKGKEELHIQAEKDMSTLVKNNESLSVGGDRSVSVTGNQSVSISGKGKSPVHSTVNVTGKHTLDASDTIKIQAPTSITLECGGSTIVMVPGKITITAGGGAEVVLDANALTHSSAGAKTLHDANVLHQSVAGSKVLLDANALSQASGGAKVLLDGNVLAQSSGGSKVALDSDAMIDGAGKATVKGASEANLAAGGSVKASPAGVEVSGALVKMNS